MDRTETTMVAEKDSLVINKACLANWEGGIPMEVLRQKKMRGLVVVLLLIYASTLAASYRLRSEKGLQHAVLQTNAKQADKPANVQSQQPAGPEAIGPVTTHVIAGGGGTTSGRSIRINATIGEGGASSPMGGGSLTLTGGFPATDNAFVTGNQIDIGSFFVYQHYIDFLNREPDSSGLGFWTNNITSCGTDPSCNDVTRINVSAAFYLSIEFQQTGYLVERIYKAAFGDAAGASTLGGTHTLAVPVVRLSEFLSDTQQIGSGVVVNQGDWQTTLENNKQAFTTGFVQRSRFTTAFPNSMTSAQFVDKLNGNAGNPLSQSERNQLVSDLSSDTKTRAQALRTIAEHPNLVNSEFNRAFVLMQFFGYLRRNPDDPQDTDYTGYDFWLTKLNQFNGNFQNAEMVKAFIASSEYRRRFGP